MSLLIDNNLMSESRGGKPIVADHKVKHEGEVPMVIPSRAAPNSI